MAEPVVIDPDDMTWDEVEEFEDRTKIVLGNHRGALPATAMRVMAYLFMRRDNPELTYEDLGDLKVRATITTASRPDPTGAAASRTKRK